MHCEICNHAKRAEIEKACLLRTFGDNQISIADIAKEYGVDAKELQVHALMHIPLEEGNEETVQATQSIAGKIKMREADILRQVMEEQFVTFRSLGAKINSIVAHHTTEEPTLGQISKSVTDLYLGTSQSIRDTAEKLIRMDLAVNGEKDEGMQQLANLVNVIRGN